MLERFGLLAGLLVRFVFAHVRVRPELVERVRQLASQGGVIYVMRYRSMVDYLLVNAVLRREGLPLARFAPGVSTVWWRPFPAIVRWYLGRGSRTVERCAALVEAGEPVLIFMRSRTVAGRRRRALAAARVGQQYLREVVRAAAAAPRPTFLVPVALFPGTGFHKRESRFAALLYSVQEAPGEAKRLFNYLWNAGQTQLTLGKEISLHRFVEEHRREGEERTARRLARVLQIFLYREERVVLGPTLLPNRLVRDSVLRDPELARLIRRLAAERGIPRRKVVSEARGYFDEMAARFNGLYFGIIAFVFHRILPRIFSGLQTLGLDGVVECMREHPIVLVPCHRSHFDYLFLTYIFHSNYLSPPHIAAGHQPGLLAPGPALPRRRRLLHPAVLRRQRALQDGVPQVPHVPDPRRATRRSSSSRVDAPHRQDADAEARHARRPIVNAFSQGVRRDLYLVPVSIHYGRIVEEEAYTREVSGEAKERSRRCAAARAAPSSRSGSGWPT